MQRDSTYMFNLDGMIPKLCLLAQELGEEGREKQMRSASLQALSAMVICTMFIWTYYYVFYLYARTSCVRLSIC